MPTERPLSGRIRMLVPAESACFELTVLRSRFLARIVRLDSAEDPKNELDVLRREYPDASHHVFAWVFGFDNAQFGYSDDREPHGTAGRPVYEVLHGSGVGNSLLTVVRYFGGTKLGTGGLARAYQEAAAGVLQRVTVSEFREMLPASITLNYALYERFKILLERFEGRIITEDFAELVTVTLEYPSGAAELLESALRDMTRGKSRLE